MGLVTFRRLGRAARPGRAPNGTLWLRDRAIATGAFLGKDVMVGPDSQVTLSSAW
jgi:hypothetical protein